MFFNSFDEHVRKIFKEDIDKYLVISWIIFNANYQEEYNGLGRYECYFTHRMMAEKFGLSRKKSAQIIEQLVEDNFVKWIKKSKNQHEKSVIELLDSRNSRCNSTRNSKCTSVRNTQTIEDKGIDKYEEIAGVTAKETAEETATEHLSKNISKNISKNKSKKIIYRLIPQTPHVKLTEEQFDNFVRDYGKQMVEDTLLELENYIVNGKGASYKNHELVVRTWINRNLNKILQSQIVTSNQNHKQSVTFSPKPKKQERFTNIAQHNWDFEKLEQAEWLYQQQKIGNLTSIEYEQALKELS